MNSDAEGTYMGGGASRLGFDHDHWAIEGKGTEGRATPGALRDLLRVTIETVLLTKESAAFQPPS